MKLAITGRNSMATVNARSQMNKGAPGALLQTNRATPANKKIMLATVHTTLAVAIGRPAMGSMSKVGGDFDLPLYRTYTLP